MRDVYLLALSFDRNSKGPFSIEHADASVFYNLAFLKQYYENVQLKLQLG
jgi:hypothetical protein